MLVTRSNDGDTWKWQCVFICLLPKCACQNKLLQYFLSILHNYDTCKHVLPTMKCLCWFVSFKLFRQNSVAPDSLPVRSLASSPASLLVWHLWSCCFCFPRRNKNKKMFSLPTINSYCMSAKIQNTRILNIPQMINIEGYIP
jgi:hypothetical protein